MYKFKAVFQGKNLSLGYQVGKEYDIIISGKYIQRADGTGRCPYESLEAFLNNWLLVSVTDQQIPVNFAGITLMQQAQKVQRLADQVRNISIASDSPKLYEIFVALEIAGLDMLNRAKVDINNIVKQLNQVD